ncbi:hypothetical protein V6N13_100255 [Hibiscus sabdariffa]
MCCSSETPIRIFWEKSKKYRPSRVVVRAHRAKTSTLGMVSGASFVSRLFRECRRFTEWERLTYPRN